MSIARYAFNFATGNGMGRMTSPPMISRDGYPFDFDGSLDYVRSATGQTLWPDVATYPNGDGIGCVSGFMPQMDAAVYSQMIARLPWGPSVNQVPTDPMRYIGQMTFPTLQQIGAVNQGEVSP